VELEFVLVEPAEQEWSEVERPDSVGDLLESNVFLEQGVADVDPTSFPADAAIAADASDFEVSGVLGLGETIGVGPGGGCVDLGG
jgi:hypothetical protein